MSDPCLLYYITDRTAFPGDEPARRRLLLEKIAEAAAASIDYIQLRERDLSTSELESLARDAASAIRKLRTENRKLRTALLINSRTDVALAGEADGVHLRAHDISPEDVRKIWRDGICDAHETCGSWKLAREFPPRVPVITVSCHSAQQVSQAAKNRATFAVFAPIFEKKDAREVTPTGLAALREACRAQIPVLALGGITLQNAESCLQAGAVGIAAIRLFQENHISTIIRHLRS